MAELSRQLLAEFIGSFAICFVGILAITGAGLVPAGELVAVALAFGLTVAVMTVSLAAVSGAHFNPAATLALLALGRIPPVQALAYIAAQVGGAVAASGLLALLFGVETASRGCTALAAGLGPFQAGLLEALACFLLFSVAFGCAANPALSRQGAWAVGMTVTLDILAIGPLTGAALNPARAFGPALVSGNWTAQPLYWLGPIAGALLAALLPGLLFPARRAAAD